MAPGRKPFDTIEDSLEYIGLLRDTIETTGSSPIYTVCPVGHVSDVPFSPENARTIRASVYSCARK